MPRVFALLCSSDVLGVGLPGERRGPNVARTGRRHSFLTPPPIVAPGSDGDAARPTAPPPRRPTRRRRSRRRSSPPTSCSTSRTSTAAATPRSRTAATTAPAPSPTRCSRPALLKTPARLLAASCAGACKGKGAWITVYTNPGHAYAVIAGLRLDTSTGGVTSRDHPHRRARPALARRPAQRRAASRRATRSASSRQPRALALQLVALGEPVAPARLRLALAPLLVRLDGLERRDLGRAPVVVERDHREVGGVGVAHARRRAAARPSTRTPTSIDVRQAALTRRA